MVNSTDQFQHLNCDHLRKTRKSIFHFPASSSYDVYFRQIEQPLELLRIATAVQARYKSFQSIERVSTTKLKVIFTNREDANKIVMDSSFSASYRVFIPATSVEINGVIDLEGMDPSVIAQHGIGKFRRCDVNPVPLLQFSRLAKQTVDRSYVPSAAIKVTFAGTLLPDFVEIQNVRLPVRPYFPKPMFCHVCQRFGHTAKYCANQVRCPKCLHHHDSSDCSIINDFCRLCKEHHSHISQCRIFKAKERALRKKTRQSVKSSSNTIILQTPTESQPGVSTTVDSASTRTNEGPRVSSYKLKKQAQATSSGTTPSSNNLQNWTDRTQINDPPKCKKKKSEPHTSANIPSYSNSYPIELIISRICSVYQIDQSFVDIITTLMPIIKLFWGKIIEAAPLLGHFISP